MASLFHPPVRRLERLRAFWRCEQERTAAPRYLAASVEVDGGKITAGLWADVGMPTYSGIGVYRQTFRMHG